MLHVTKPPWFFVYFDVSYELVTNRTSWAQKAYELVLLCKQIHRTRWESYEVSNPLTVVGVQFYRQVFTICQLLKKFSLSINQQ